MNPAARYTRNSDSRVFTIAGEEKGSLLIKDELNPSDVLRMKPAAFRARYTEIRATYNATLAALEPFRASIEARIVEATTKSVATAYAILEKDGMDANISTPYPRSNQGRVSYLLAKERYSFIRKWTVYTNGTRSGLNSPEPRIFIEAEPLAARIRAEARSQANDVIRAYAHKLTAKEDALRKESGTEGEVITAEYTGNLWSHSFMVYTLANGIKDTWKTNMILNVSCLGKLFNQFPTRLQ